MKKNMFKNLVTKVVIPGLAVLFGFFFSSCEGDLEPQNFNIIDESTFFKTEGDAEALVTGYYSTFNNGWAGTWWNDQGITNGMTTGGDLVVRWGGFETRQDFSWTATDGHVTFNYDEWINAITLATNVIDQVEGIDIDESAKNELIAQIRAGRAIQIFFLYEQYGPPPIVVDPEVSTDINTDFVPTRPTTEWTVNFIESELIDAEADLPAIYLGGDYGRIGAGAAMMTRLKLYMHEKQWAKAAAVAQEIENLGAFSLYPGDNYEGIWLDEGNLETIWAMPRTNDETIGVPQYWAANILPGDFRDPNGNGFTSWDGFRLDWDIYDGFDAGDVRLSVAAEDYLVDDGAGGLIMKQGRPAGDPEGTALAGALPLKYGGVKQNFNGAPGDGDVVVYRYADVLLLWAEALNEIAALDPNAIAKLQQVRARAGVDGLTPTFASQAELRDYILEERLRELFCEGWSRQDKIRHGTFISDAQARGISLAQSHHVLFPIPQGAIDANPEIIQNPGYGGN